MVEEVRAIVLEAAQECIPLLYRMWMESEFIVEEAEITKVSVLYKFDHFYIENIKTDKNNLIYKCRKISLCNILKINNHVIFFSCILRL